MDNIDEMERIIYQALHGAAGRLIYNLHHGFNSEIGQALETAENKIDMELMLENSIVNIAEKKIRERLKKTKNGEL